MDETLHTLLDTRVVAIYRHVEPHHCVDISLALYEVGIRAYEVTLNSQQALAAIEALRVKLPDDAVVGAGTVLTPQQVADAERAGASFLIAPNTEPAVVSAAKQRGLVSVPGALTPTEVIQAHNTGADIVKVFPISPVAADYIRQLRGPLGDKPLLASGGINPGLASECFTAGCQAVGVGINLFGADAITNRDWLQLQHAAQQFRAAANLSP